MIYPPFAPAEKQLRRDALAQLERCEEAWERWRGRPLAAYPRMRERAHEEGLEREERLSVFVLAATGRGSPLDTPWPTEARERVRACLRLVRAYRQRGDADNVRFYLSRLQRSLTFYRRAITRSRQEMETSAAGAGPKLQAAE